jgi:hypothetical protein
MPAWASITWAAFAGTDEDAAIAGDIAMLETEVTPTLQALRPAEAQAEAHFKVEQWNDVPPASLDYGAARDSLKSHIKTLVKQLSQRR